MGIITKEDVLEAFKNTKRKRYNLLYTYYREQLFDKGFSAEIISKKISEDLGISISVSQIYSVNKLYLNGKKGIRKTESQSETVQKTEPQKPPVKTEQTPKPAVQKQPLKSADKQIQFTNSDEERFVNKFDGVNFDE
jgi:hypothetical protein